MPTIFGYALQGSQESYKSYVKNSVSANFCVAASDVKVLWDLETLGIKDNEELNAVDKALIDQFERNLKFLKGRYETDLLWKFSNDELEKNFFLAEKKFNELKNGFSKIKNVAIGYKEIIIDRLKIEL